MAETVVTLSNPVIDQLTLSVDLQRSGVIRIEISTLTGQVVYSDLKPVRRVRQNKPAFLPD